MNEQQDKASPVEPVVMCDIPLPVQIRLRAIEVCLSHYGFVNRSMLCDLFGLSAPQVSKDIALYRKFTGDGIFYNQATRRIEKLRDFVKLFNT